MGSSKLLQCPVCRKGPIEGDSCLNCGRQFVRDSGRPALFPESQGIAFEVRYVSLDEVQNALSSVFKRPAIVGAGSGVFHLDKAHIPYIKELPPGSTVLEVGCGGGQMRKWVEGLGLNYLGTDISVTRVHAHLQQYGGPDFLSDVHDLPVSDKSVDLVYSAAVVEHLAAPHRAMQEIFRVLKPGGLYLGNCSFMEPWHDESFFHVTPNGAVALLLQAGFEPVAVWPSERYSGYKSLLRMDNSATKMLRSLGSLMQGYSRMFFKLKKMLRGSGRYSESAQLADLAKTAGAIDWVARKPGGL